MQDELGQRVLKAWDEYVNAGYQYISDEGTEQESELRKTDRNERLPHIRELLVQFQSSEIDFLTLRREMDRESKQHPLWGFRGMSLMFFNMLRNTAQRQDDVENIESLLRDVIRKPPNPETAAEKIEQLSEHVDEMKERAENKRKAPSAGFIPAFLSYFWQVQEPDEVPIYYESTREAYRDLEVWKPSGSLGRRYAGFWETTEEIRSVVQNNRGIEPELWDVEYAMLRWRNRSKLRDQPSDSDGTSSDNGGSAEIETYADYEAGRSLLESDDLAVDITDLYFENLDEIQGRIETALRAGNHIMLIGPPGTGKTKLAKQICSSIVSDAFKLVTATADWSTFDTIGGYQPEADQDLAFKPGVFLDRFQDANHGPQNEWLIIDEINRADIDKAFGSLFSALTGDDVTLPFTNDDGNRIEIIGDHASRDLAIEPYRYYIPDDWRMIATMNTLDKTSLYEMSYAFMRRWAFVPIPVPDSESIDAGLVEQYVLGWDGVSVDEDRCATVAEIWRIINRQREIGPAIVEDIYRYIQTGGSGDYTSPIAMYVVPQLEGIREENIIQLVEELSRETPVGREQLAEFVTDYHQIPTAKFE